jgi:uncharacterized protein (TIGR02266 family)
METPMTLMMPMVKIRLKCADVETFVDKHHADVNIGGLFVRTRSPLAAGTSVSFDVRLADNSCLFRGSGVVVWARADETLAPLLDPGMMLGFDELRDGTRENFERVLARKRTVEEAADTIPTLVRTFSGEPQPLPMTTEMSAEQMEALRAQMRADVDAAVESAPIVPTMVPSEPREQIEAKPLPSELPRVSVAKILMLRPPTAPRRDGDAAAVDPRDVTPLPPVARYSDTIEQAPAGRGDVTALIGTRSAASDMTRLIAVAVFSGTLLFTMLALIRLDVVQRMLQWINGA